MLRLIDWLVAAALLGGLVLGAVLIGGPERLAGRARVVDGDTIALDGRRIRLAGIDAPELDQTCGSPERGYPCGEVARDALRRLVEAGELACRVSGRDRYGRDVAACEVGGADIGRTLVQRGLALAYGRYLGEEREARSARRGLWADSFVPPSRWRDEHRSGGAAPRLPPT
jgi:endonuclease YncB( thermonuclease family)